MDYCTDMLAVTSENQVARSTGATRSAVDYISVNSVINFGPCCNLVESALGA